MSPEHAAAPRAERANSLDELQGLDGERRGAHHARAVGHEHDGEREHLIADARADDAHDGDGQEHEREREEHVEHAHDQVIEQALAVAGHEPEEQGDDARGHGGHDADEERDPPAPDQAAQDVPSLLVRPEEVPGRARRGESVDLHGLERIPRADERRRHGRAAGDRDDHEAGEGLAVPHERAQERGEAGGAAPWTRPRAFDRQDGRHRAGPTRAGPAGRGRGSAGRPRG